MPHYKVQSLIDWITPIFLLFSKFAPFVSVIVAVFAGIFYAYGISNKRRERAIQDLDKRIKQAQLKKLENGND